MSEIIYKNESYAIMGACSQVYNELGVLVNFAHYPKLNYERIVKSKRVQSKTDLSDVCP